MGTKAKGARARKGEEASHEEVIEGEEFPSIHETTEEEWHDLIDRTAQRHLHMSADEFIERWKAGEWPNPDGTPVMNVVILLSPEDQKAGQRAGKRRQRMARGRLKVKGTKPAATGLEEEEALPEVRELTAEEWHELVDAAARHHLHMSADEFIERWEAGEWPNPDGTPVMNVLMLLSVGDQRII